MSLGFWDSILGFLGIALNPKLQTRRSAPSALSSPLTRHCWAQLQRLNSNALKLEHPNSKAESLKPLLRVGCGA